MSIFVVVGLGNPGPEFAKTRHNVGFIIIDSLVKKKDLIWTFDKKHNIDLSKTQANGHTILFIKPQTYMNESGVALRSLCSFYKISSSHIACIYDDITLSFGETKTNAPKSSGGHNGVRSILSHIGPGFIAHRIGIGKKPHPQMILADYVLSSLSENEISILQSKTSLIENAIQTNFKIN